MIGRFSTRLCIGAVLLAAATTARADQSGECHFVDVDFVPAADLQIVAWIEDTHGNYVDTAYITQATGSFGIGNRPGRFDFNSAPKWPYGRRVTTFPVWANKHGVTFPEVEFQDGQDSDLSHGFSESSHESHFCRPLLPAEFPTDPDALTCATSVYTDKGVLSTTKTSHYPPRSDLVRQVGTDTDSVDQYATLNPFDSVSQATPVGGMPAQLTWSTPATVPDGDYLLFVEVSKEADMDDAYNPTSYPPPDGISYGQYGEPYRGQPSVVYRVPFAIAAADPGATTVTDYTGYGDPDGADGTIRAPDATIATGVSGSGASRLQLVAGDGGIMYRVRAHPRVQHDAVAPAAPADLQVVPRAPALVASFIAPGDDGMTGTVRGYDIRVAAGAPITDATFDAAPRVATPAQLVAGGDIQDVPLEGLLPDTDYSIAVRAVDDCHNTGPITVTAFHTAIPTGSVDACFIATAAYGSVMAADVGMLRHFRDVMLRRSALGELFVETYYTFGPPVAHVVGESELLRASARGALAPLVDRVRAIVF